MWKTPKDPPMDLSLIHISSKGSNKRKNSKKIDTYFFPTNKKNRLPDELINTLSAKDINTANHNINRETNDTSSGSALKYFCDKTITNQLPDDLPSMSNTCVRVSKAEQDPEIPQEFLLMRIIYLKIMTSLTILAIIWRSQLMIC